MKLNPGAAAVVSLAVLLAGSVGSAWQSTDTRSVYVTAVDRQGVPVLDLGPGDFQVKEGGRTREVAALTPATDRMHIALIVDDNGTGLFRSSVAQFIQRLHTEAEFAITVVTGQALKIVDFTADLSKLSTGVNYLGARPATPDGGQLLGAIYESARDLQRRESRRPVIVVLTVGGDEHNPMPAHHVLNQLRDSRASLNVFEMTNSLLRPTAPVGRASQLLEESLNINEVLGDGSKQSGGRKDEIVAVTGVVRGLLQLAEELAHQYQLSYRLPAGTKPSERVEVSVARQGTMIRAPTRISVQ